MYDLLLTLPPLQFATQLKLVWHILKEIALPSLIIFVLFQMFKPVRIIATIILLVAIGLIFVGAFVIKIGVSGRFDNTA